MEVNTDILCGDSAYVLQEIEENSVDLIVTSPPYVEENISSFHEKRLNKIETLRLKEVLQKKNPYLFKAKNIQTADEIV